MPFNVEQLSSWGEATRIATKLNNSSPFRQTGIRVKPQSPPYSGIYLPPWVSGPHGDPIPSAPGLQFLHFRFTNGMEGMNVGLVRELFAKYPASPLFVIDGLLHEVQTGAQVIAMRSVFALRIAA